jgi:hypothetical protein
LDRADSGSGGDLLGIPHTRSSRLMGTRAIVIPISQAEIGHFIRHRGVIRCDPATVWGLKSTALIGNDPPIMIRIEHGKANKDLFAGVEAISMFGRIDQRFLQTQANF